MGQSRSSERESNRNLCGRHGKNKQKHNLAICVPPTRTRRQRNAKPAALSITSIDIRVKITLRRARSPASPSPNKIAARSNALLTDSIASRDSLSSGTRRAQVIRSDNSSEQENRDKFHAEQIRPEERQRHFHWPGSQRAPAHAGCPKRYRQTQSREGRPGPRGPPMRPGLSHARSIRLRGRRY